MLGDEAQPAGSVADDEIRERAASGPRHAAPRKSLLTKLHVPAGKAVALAAMPTAVLMGMGFTPHLAQADDLPKSPLKPGPCVTVTQPDTPSPSAAGLGAAKDRAGTAATPKPADRVKPKPSASPSPADRAEPAPAPSPSAPQPTPTPTVTAGDNPVTGLLPQSGTNTAQPSPSPSPSAGATGSTSSTSAPSVDPLDPLGLGNLVGGLLDGATATATPAPTTQAPQPAPTTTAPPAPDPGSSTAPTAPAAPANPPASGGTSAGSTGSGTAGSSDTAGDGAKETVKGTSDAAGKAAKGQERATATPKPSDAVRDGSAALDGGLPDLCPTPDALALAGAKAEHGVPLLPDAPWILRTTKLTLYGLQYHGIVKVRTWNGAVKDVLKYTATGVDIENLHQIVEAPGDSTTHVTGREGSTSTIRNGTVTMYTESLTGNLLGLARVTYTPQAPPPATLPVVFLTDVTVVQAGQFGGDLHVPGMRVLPGQPR